MPITNENQARTIAVMLQELRPEWPWQHTMKTLEKNHNHPAPYATIIQAAITKAQDPNTRTPAAIFLPGPHWPKEAQAHMPPPPRCEDHEHPAHNCPGCRADVLVGDRPPHKIGKHWNIPTPSTPQGNRTHGARTKPLM